MFTVKHPYYILLLSIKHFPVFVVFISCCVTLCRFISLLDSVLPHLVPAWDYSLGTFNQIKVRHHGVFKISNTDVGCLLSLLLSVQCTVYGRSVCSLQQ